MAFKALHGRALRSTAPLGGQQRGSIVNVVAPLYKARSIFLHAPIHDTRIASGAVLGAGGDAREQAGASAEPSRTRKQLWMAAIKPPMYSVGFIPVLVRTCLLLIMLAGGICCMLRCVCAGARSPSGMHGAASGRHAQPGMQHGSHQDDNQAIKTGWECQLK